MSSSFPMVPLSKVLTQYKEYIEAPKPKIYPKLSVKLYGKGVVLDTPVDGATLRMKRHQIARSGQVILSEIWGKKGAIGLVPKEGDGALCTSHFFLFDVKLDKTEPAYLQAIFAANYLQRQLEKPAKGTTGYAAVRPNHLLSAKIPLPSLKEQKRIVTRIERFLVRIEEARRLRKEAVEEVETLLFSVRSQIFDVNDITELPNLQDVCIDVTDGTHDTPKYVGEGVPFLTGKNISLRGLDFDNVKYITQDDHIKFSQHCPVERNDVLLTLIGTTDKVAIVDTDIEFSVKNVGLLKPDKNRLEPRYLFHFLQSRAFQKQVISHSKKTAQTFLGLKRLRTIKIPLPSLTEQCLIITYLDSLQEKLDELRKLQDETEKETEELIPSILDKTFKGEL